MNATRFAPRIINQQDKITLAGITSLTISNYGQSELTVTINDVSRPIPAFSAAIGLPYTFDVPGDGSAFDIEMSFEFKAVGTKNAILDYRKIKEC